MVCSDLIEGATVAVRPSSRSLVPAEERLSALSLSECQHFLESVAYHKTMLAELANR